MGYFAVKLKNNNKEMDFQQNCNNIDYTSSKNYVIFANKNDDANKLTILALIPHDEIKYIVNYKGGE